MPGVDVVHDEHGDGWVWGAGLGRVTVRFETADSEPGPIRTMRDDDPMLHRRQRASTDNTEALTKTLDTPTPQQMFDSGPQA
jgi:hypothetical protein